MASIQERDGKFRVQIRRNGFQAEATFSDRPTAELWAKYKDEVYNELPKFDPKIEDMFTLREAIELKVRQLQEKEAEKKTIQDTSNLTVYFKEIVDKPMSEITMDDFNKHCERMLNTLVKRGGPLSKSRPNQQAPRTVHRKFRYLSIVYSLMIENGMKIPNYPLAIIRELEKRERPEISFERKKEILTNLSNHILS